MTASRTWGDSEWKTPLWYPSLLGAMKFIKYSRPEARDCKVDWDAAVEVTDVLRSALHPHDLDALHPHDLDALHVGRLRRPFVFQPPVPGRRSRHGFVKHPSPEPIPHERGAIVFAYPDESVFFIEASEQCS